MNHIAVQQPTLKEMLEEPVVRLVMERDGVTPQQVLSLFAELRAALSPQSDAIIALSAAEPDDAANPEARP